MPSDRPPHDARRRTGPKRSASAKFAASSPPYAPQPYDVRPSPGREPLSDPFEQPSRLAPFSTARADRRQARESPRACEIVAAHRSRSAEIARTDSGNAIEADPASPCFADKRFDFTAGANGPHKHSRKVSPYASHSSAAHTLQPSALIAALPSAEPCSPSTGDGPFVRAAVSREFVLMVRADE